MLVDPEAARDARREGRALYPVKTAQHTSECPYCLALIEPGDAIALPDFPPFRHAHVDCCEFEDDLRVDPHATRRREEREWRRRMEGYNPRPVRVPPMRRRKKRRSAA